jgi:uncharacterized protein (TIGR02722 family)
MKISSIVHLFVAGLGLALFSGCVTDGVAYTEASNPKTQVVSLNKVNVQDWETAADAMIQSLLTSGVVEKAPRQPALLAVDRITNKTTDANLDTDLLSKKIRIALMRTGKVQTTTTYGRQAEAQIAQDVQVKKDFLSGDAPKDRSPDYTLTGKIIEDSARAGSTRQTTYVFQLSLTDTASGAAVWEDEKTIQKTGTRASVGW